MKELIERLGKTTGPNLQLDHLIAEAITPSDGHGVLLYTASIDAALTLVPEGDGDKELYFGGADGECFAQFEVPLGRFNQGRAKSLPIAICIAALKAHSQRS